MTQNGLSWKIKAASIKLPGISGDFQILKNHIPILSLLKSGKIVIYGIDNIIENNKSIKKSNAKYHSTFYIQHGFFQFESNTAVILGDLYCKNE